MKTKTLYSCQKCGYQSAKWLGRCPDCGAWNTMEEEVAIKSGAAASRALPGGPPLPINQVGGEAEMHLPTGISEFDRVLGGGLVAGSLVLIGGDPGIGKSTLLLQAMNHVAKTGTVLYVSGEESARQIKLRGARMGVNAPGLYVLAETALENILAHIARMQPKAIVIDSIQTIFTSGLESAPGSVSQVRETAGRLMIMAKGSGIPVFIVGHVTKDGAIAGPRVLEHLVDTVLYFEGDSGHPFRILRAVKNRFGSTNEIGVFEMKEGGLCEVRNPSELFLSERPMGASGSVVVASLEGSRPVLVELQALVSASSLGVPRRTTIGVDHHRLSLLVAVLEKKVGLSLAGQDIFLNVAGGVKLNEPAADLGMVVAVASSHLDKPIAGNTLLLGEVGLTGEVRGITQPELRVKEAAKLGFSRCILPAGNLKQVKAKGLELIGVKSVDEALDKVF
ncbi:DNA repair protein RadA [Geotalea daltonii FRC-32]|uniref:DNA repair protein RadA n=1 Tax=Geotalea daltonii (strain DSM 22248 / JCM 15807 / FRC-32) TaxID=316067 RepID=B9M721_GEODF|nr:DNA repair protein RadA [Geotalea daltonii]ACM22042.1 DNA repair protein RadA [Geotalea daltonii FRC-32]